MNPSRVEEIDWGVGEILKSLKTLGIEEKTLVIFTSDNGPWISKGDKGGSALPLRGGKFETWEGGMREPTIFWSPEKIRSAVVSEIGSTMDLFTTCSKIAGAKVPKDRVIDGVDLSRVLFEQKRSPRNNMFYYRRTELYAVRLGDYKAHFITEGAYGQFGERKEHATPILYNLNEDPSEQFDIAMDRPEIIEDINALVAEHQSTLVRGKDMLAERE